MTILAIVPARLLSPRLHPAQAARAAREPEYRRDLLPQVSRMARSLLQTLGEPLYYSIRFELDSPSISTFGPRSRFVAPRLSRAHIAGLMAHLDPAICLVFSEDARQAVLYHWIGYLLLVPPHAYDDRSTFGARHLFRRDLQELVELVQHQTKNKPLQPTNQPPVSPA